MQSSPAAADFASAPERTTQVSLAAPRDPDDGNALYLQPNQAPGWRQLDQVEPSRQPFARKTLRFLEPMPGADQEAGGYLHDMLTVMAF